jgi:SAM-dependent methyltransferase
MAETGYLAAIRESYDAVAADYVRLVPKPDAIDPASRSMLAAFAELVRAAGLGPVADLGCGPGRVTAHLAGLGLPAFGIDLSPKMIMMARRAYPELRYAVGSMTALGLGDGALGGILAWYSTYHTPPEQLPGLFAEFDRTLAPGGHLLLGTYTGDDEQLRPARAFGRHRVFYHSYLLPPGDLATLLAGAGLTITAQLESLPSPAAQPRRPHACLLARKPAQPDA